MVRHPVERQHSGRAGGLLPLAHADPALGEWDKKTPDCAFMGAVR